MFEVGKFYESNNGDKMLCKGRDATGGIWLFVGAVERRRLVLWCYSDGRTVGFKHFGPFIKGPWVEKEGCK